MPQQVTALEERRFLMTLLYVSLGVLFGAVSATTIMAMLFVSKSADANREEMLSCLDSSITHQETM
jgi:hypothetical protein